MVEGIVYRWRANSGRSPLSVVWVAIALSDLCPFVKKIEQGIPKAEGSLSTIFAHPDEAGPVPGAENCKKYHRGQVKLAVEADKAVEIGQFVCEAVTDALDRVERNTAHLSQPRDGGAFHVDQIGLIGGGEALFFCPVGDDGAGHKPTIARTGITMEALAGACVDDPGDVVGSAGRQIRLERPDPTDRDDQVDGATVFNGGEGAGSSLLPGSGAGGNPLFFFIAPGPKMDIAAGARGPTADQGFEFAGDGGDDGYPGHGRLLGAYPWARNHSMAARMAG